MQHMKQKIRILATLVLCSASLGVMAGDGGWYAGVSMGSSKVKDAPSASEVDAELLSEFGITATSTVDDSGTPWKLFAGYRINNNFALEGGYVDVGRALTWNSTVTAPAAGTVSAKWKGNAWNLAAVGIVPVTDQFEIFGKVGAHRWDVDVSVSAVGGGGAAAGSLSDSGSSWLFGLGASYNLSKNFAVRAEWERYKDMGDDNTTGQADVDLLTLGVQYNF